MRANPYSQALGQLLDEDNHSDTLWADSAYRCEAIEETLKLIGFDSQIDQTAEQNQPWSQEQKQSHRTNAKTRAQVEHVFGTWVMQMGGKVVRSSGSARAKAQLGWKNLTYNLIRYTFVDTKAVTWGETPGVLLILLERTKTDELNLTKLGF